MYNPDGTSFYINFPFSASLDLLAIWSIETQCKVKKMQRYFVLSYFGEQSEKMHREVVSLLSKLHPYLNPTVQSYETILRSEHFSTTRTRSLSKVALDWFIYIVAPHVRRLTLIQRANVYSPE